MDNKNAKKWIKLHSKGQSLKMGILIVSNVLFSLLSVLFAIAVKIIIDGATNLDAVAGRTSIIKGSILIGSIVLLQFVFRIIINYLVDHIKGKLEIAFKSHLFGDILKKNYQKITDYHSGDLLNRLNTDVAVVADGVTTIVPNVVSATCRLICAIVAIVILDWIFACVFVVAGLLVYLTLTLMRAKLKSFHKQSQATSGKTHSFMQETIENLLAVKVFSANKNVTDNADNLQRENFDVKMKRAKYSVGGHAIYNMIFSLGYIFALIYGAFKIYNGVLGYGSLSAILQLVNNVQVPFASLSNVIPKYYAMLASAERILEIESIENEDQSLLENRDFVYQNLKDIIVNDLKFSYDKEIILQDASLTISKGDRVLIEGESGIGKSTFIKLLLDVYKPESGNLVLNCDDTQIPISETTRNLFSYVPQQNLLFSGTLYDNLTFINKTATEEQINNALKISCADEFVSDIKGGLDAKVGENGLGLSEGQIQRVAIARAIISGAPVMLLDESTSALDETTEKKILYNLNTLKDKTLILISHKKTAREICNKVIKIQDKKFLDPRKLR
ncbi:MAG: ABC transporter ATP-binding protein [Clostridia bacterium]|nr:ABC transporter ATP-binding protein [Clostridia bacterium]